MLIVNGKDDLQTPIADLYILLEYGSPKSARVSPRRSYGANTRDSADDYQLVEKCLGLSQAGSRALF